MLIEYGKLMKYTPTPTKNAYCYDGPLVLRQFGPDPNDAADVLETYPWCAHFSIKTGLHLNFGLSGCLTARTSTAACIAEGPCDALVLRLSIASVLRGLLSSRIVVMTLRLANVVIINVQDAGLRHGGMRAIHYRLGEVARYRIPAYVPFLLRLLPMVHWASLCMLPPAGFPNLYVPEKDPSSPSFAKAAKNSTAGKDGKRRSRRLHMLDWATGLSW